MVTESKDTGQNVVLGGLFVQIIFFGFFLISAIIFQLRISRRPTSMSVADYVPWKKHMTALHLSSVLILVRSIVRVVEYIQGPEGVIMSNEVFIYVFDGLLMFLVLVIFVVIHPSEVNCLLGRGSVMTAKGGLKVCEVSVAV